jgi:SAM-dependent methyltransferase
MNTVPHIAIVFPHFFTNRIAAVARYVVELMVRHPERDITLITTQSAGASPVNYGFTDIIFLRCPHWRFYREAACRCRSADLVIFYGGYSGAVLFMSAFIHLPAPKILNLFSSHFNPRSLFTLKFSDFFRMFNRIFRHQYFYSLILPGFVFRHLFSRSRVRALIVPSRRLKETYDRLLGKSICQVLRPGGDISSFDGKNREPVDEIEKTKEKIVVFHSGLASLLRGVDDLIIAFAGLPEALKKDAILFLALYLRPGERISSMGRIKKLLDTNLSPEEYILLTAPIEDIGPLYDRSDISVFPYRYTGDIPEVPLTLVELIGRKKIVISSSIGCLGEWVDANFLVRPNDVTGLRAVICGLIERFRVGDRPAAKNRPTSWDEYYRSYRELLVNKPGLDITLRSGPDVRGFFNREAATYQRVLEGNPGVRYVNEIEKTAVNRLLDRAPGGIFVDLGTGKGRFASLLEARGNLVIAIDLSLEMLSSAVQRRPMICADAARIPLGEETFDGLISMRTLKYVPDTAGALREVYRILKPGGIAILQFPNRRSYQALVKGCRFIGDKSYNTMLKLRSFGELHRLSEGAGFVVKGVEHNIRLPFFVYGWLRGRGGVAFCRFWERAMDIVLPRYVLCRDYTFLLQKPGRAHGQINT